MKKLFLIPAILVVLIILSCSKENSIKTNLIEKEVEYTVDSINFKGFLVYDKSTDGKRPGILIVHEWWGQNEYARNRARMLAEMGYTALALDMYGNGKNANHPEDAQKFSGAIFSNVEIAEARFLAAYDLLRQQETVESDNIAAVGYCFGGSIVLHMARIGTDLKAVASFHGGLQAITPAKEGQVKAFVLACNGADDPFVTQEQVDAFKTEMENAKVKYRFINYEGAIHSFTNPGADSLGKKFNMPFAYNENADKDSWQAMKDIFEKEFGH